MATRPQRLPDFRTPPLVEVALSVQFHPLEKLRAVQLGLLWNEFRTTLPKVEEHVPLLAPIEEFDLKLASSPMVQIEQIDSADAPPAPRVWFLNEAGTELIQVQQNRFLRNWRKVGTGDEYPRYERIRDRFEQELEIFCAFVKREGLGELHFDQCELTYVNHIVSGDGWERHGQLANVVRLWCSAGIGGGLPEAEDAHLQTRYVIRDDEGRPLGRLYVVLQSAYQLADKKPIFVLRLMARGKPLEGSLAGALAFLDQGRNHVVHAFAGITTPNMHKIWGRTDES